MKLRGRNKVTPEFNMSSMTDIVFLLLIFFMIASTLVSAEAIDLLLPKASTSTSPAKNVSVRVNKKQQYFVNNRQVSKNKLEAEVLSKVSSNGQKFSKANCRSKTSSKNEPTNLFFYPLEILET